MLSRTLIQSSVRNVYRSIRSPGIVLPGVSFYSTKVGSTIVTPGEKDELRIKVAPIKRTGETLENKRARLVYQSRKRGILETDLLLSRFAARYLDSMTPEELDEYDSLLDELDWDIYYWATRNYTITPLPEKFKDSKLLAKLASRI